MYVNLFNSYAKFILYICLKLFSPNTPSMLTHGLAAGFLFCFTLILGIVNGVRRWRKRATSS
jgi:hypothetical protein